jgi:hypothetical protein
MGVVSRMEWIARCRVPGMLLVRIPLEPAKFQFALLMKADREYISKGAP